VPTQTGLLYEGCLRPQWRSRGLGTRVPDSQTGSACFARPAFGAVLDRQNSPAKASRRTRVGKRPRAARVASARASAMPQEAKRRREALLPPHKGRKEAHRKEAFSKRARSRRAAEKAVEEKRRQRPSQRRSKTASRKERPEDKASSREGRERTVSRTVQRAVPRAFSRTVSRSFEDRLGGLHRGPSRRTVLGTAIIGPATDGRTLDSAVWLRRTLLGVFLDHSTGNYLDQEFGWELSKRRDQLQGCAS